MSTINLGDLIDKLQAIKAIHGGDLPVVTDSEASVVDAEYNDTEGQPAAVLAIDLD